MPSLKCVSVWSVSPVKAVSIIFLRGIIILDLFLCLLQEQGAKPASEPLSTQAEPIPDSPAEHPAEVADETWEEKEDKQNTEPDRPKAALEQTGQKYQYKEGTLRLRLVVAET